MALAIAGVQPAASADITVSVQRRNDAVVIEASALLKADVATAWQVLTDYDRYVEFVPGLRSSRVVGRSGATVTVEQSGDATLWLLRAPVDVTYEITELPPSRLLSRATGGCTCTLESTYALTASGSRVRLDYAGRLVTVSEIRGAIEQAAGEQSIARHFQALADEIERRGAAADSALVEGAGSSKRTRER